MTIRLLLADDHRIVRQTLRRAVESEGFEVVGEAGDGREAVTLAEAHTPDVVLMDVAMPGLDGVEAARLVRLRTPGTQVVVLAIQADADVIARARDAGVAGCVTGDATIEELVGVLRLAAARDGDARSAHGLAGATGITPRETEVLQLIGEGASPPEVAARLSISVKTVKNHLSSIYEKLGARDRTQAVLKGLRLGIISLDRE